MGQHVPARRVFLLIYVMSGAVALLYEVVWSRLLTLQMGNTVAAIGTVLAAFMGGLAGGAALGGRFSLTLSRRQALRAYASLEPRGRRVRAARARGAHGTPANPRCDIRRRRWGRGVWPHAPHPQRDRHARADGGDGGHVSTGRTVVRESGRGRGDRDRCPVCAEYAGRGTRRGPDRFALLPSLGLWGATLVGVAVNVAVAAGALGIARYTEGSPDASGAPAAAPTQAVPAARRRHRRAAKAGDRTVAARRAEPSPLVGRTWLAASALGLSGLVALTYEVAWTRILALIIGPTTYAFSAMLTTFIGGLAGGAVIGARLTRWWRYRIVSLGMTLILAGLGRVAPCG